MEALIHFVERPGELLTKRELMKLLWPNVVVEENNLNQVVSVLRRVLGERPAEHRYIVTAPGRGYRFVAAVRTVDGQAKPAVQADALSLAVLPFTNRGSSSDSAHLGDAIAIDLVRSISANSRIRVAPHSASFAFRHQPPDLRAIADTLNVSLLLEGDVSREAGRTRVAVRLMDAQTGLQRFAREAESDNRDLEELQGELAREIRRAVDPLAPPVLAARGSVDPEAYSNYLRALAHTMRPSADSVEASIQLLRAAGARDPNFARARSLLAIQYTTCVMYGFGAPDALDLARNEAAAALAMDDQNGETHCASAVIDCLGGSWCRAEESFRIAHSLSADPLISGLRCAYLSQPVGHLTRAMHQAEHALAVAPTHPIGAQMLAILYQLMGEDAHSSRYAEIAVALGQSRSLAPLTDIFAMLALRTGQSAEAQALMLSTLPERLRQPAYLTGSGRLRELEAAFTPEELDPPARKRLILWHVLRNDLDAAYDLAHRSLDRYAREGTVGGAWGMLWLAEMGRFRDDARFDQFARRLRLFEYWNEYGPPDGYSLSAGRLVRAV
jgi:TolB-like protein